MLDTGLFRAEVSLIVGALVVLALCGTMLVCNRRSRLVGASPIWVGLAVRLAAVAVAAAVPSIGHKLSSTDEAAFLATTHRLAALPLTDGRWLNTAVHWTEVIPWALTFKLFGNCGTLVLRLEQIGFSLAAVIIVSATASRIGGRRAGLIAAWIAALEPSSVYFAGLLHQESLCMLGEALLLAALVDLWIRVMSGLRLGLSAAVSGLTGLVGLALIFGTRSYMAFFAGVAVVLVLAAAWLCRRLGLTRGLLVLGSGAVLLALAGILAAPGVVPHSLASLQYQLNYHYAGANLAFGHATVTNSTGLLETIVERTVDLLLRPYPWQLGSAAQQAAVVGTLVWYLLMVVTIVLTFRQGFAEPLVPGLVLFVCEALGFALTLIDAGEGFRHRINLILLLAVPLGVLVDGHLRRRECRHFSQRLTRLGRHKLEGVLPSARPLTVPLAGIVGLATALGFVVALPVRYVASVSMVTPNMTTTDLPAGATLTPSAALYGALGPGITQPVLTFTATAPTARAATAELRSRTDAEPVTVVESPRTFRDLLLGLLAGSLLGLASILVKPRG